MIIDNLPTIPSTVTTGDELAVERGTTTYKIDYNALAAAILDGAVTKQLSTISDCNDNTLQVSDGMIHYYRTNSNTANTPYKQGITQSSEGVLFVFGGQDYTTQIHYCVSDMHTYIRSKSGSGSTWGGIPWAIIPTINDVPVKGFYGSTGNIDNLHAPGLYYLNGCAASGFSGTIYGGLIVIDNNYSSRTVQVYLDVFSDRIYYRRFEDSWSAWKQLAFT